MHGILDTKCEVISLNSFQKDLKKAVKQGKDINKLIYVIKKLANKENLDYKFRNHKLTNSRIYKDCFECHIEPDWLLIYKYCDDTLILLLVSTGSHSELFK